MRRGGPCVGSWHLVEHQGPDVHLVSVGSDGFLTGAWPIVPQALRQVILGFVGSCQPKNHLALGQWMVPVASHAGILQQPALCGSTAAMALAAAVISRLQACC